MKDDKQGHFFVRDECEDAFADFLIGVDEEELLLMIDICRRFEEYLGL